MSEGTVGLLVLAAVCLASSLAWHWRMASYFAASIGATVTSVVFFQLLAYVHVGYLDPFFVIAAITSGMVALFMALVVGLPFRQRRRRAAVDRAAT